MAGYSLKNKLASDQSTASFIGLYSEKEEIGLSLQGGVFTRQHLPSYIMKMVHEDELLLYPTPGEKSRASHSYLFLGR